MKAGTLKITNTSLIKGLSSCNQTWLGNPQTKWASTKIIELNGDFRASHVWLALDAVANPAGKTCNNNVGQSGDSPILRLKRRFCPFSIQYLYSQIFRIKWGAWEQLRAYQSHDSDKSIYIYISINCQLQYHNIHWISGGTPGVYWGKSSSQPGYIITLHQS
jgi:hypothetical protein